MTNKIKVKLLQACGNPIYQRTASTGIYNNDVFTAAQVEANPSKFEIVESNPTASSILRESFPEGWVKTKEVTGMRQRTGFREAQPDAKQQLKATVNTLTLRNFSRPSSVTSAGEGTWKRGGVSVVVSDDGSWTCGKISGSDAQHLDTLLDTEFPESAREIAQRAEANRRRVEKAYQLLGLNLAESKVAADTEEEISLTERWARLLGSDDAAQIVMKGKR